MFRCIGLEKECEWIGDNVLRLKVKRRHIPRTRVTAKTRHFHQWKSPVMEDAPSGLSVFLGLPRGHFFPRLEARSKTSPQSSRSLWLSGDARGSDEQQSFQCSPVEGAVRTNSSSLESARQGWSISRCRGSNQ